VENTCSKRPPQELFSVFLNFLQNFYELFTLQLMPSGISSAAKASEQIDEKKQKNSKKKVQYSSMIPDNVV